MRFCRGGQEVILDSIEEIDSSNGQKLTEPFDFIFKVGELMSYYGLKYSLHLGFGRYGIIDDVKLGLESLRYFSSSSSRFTHCGQDL